MRDRGEDFLLLVQTSDDAELEVWAAERHLEPFEQTLKKPLRLEAAMVPPQPARSSERKSGRRA